MKKLLTSIFVFNICFAQAQSIAIPADANNLFKPTVASEKYVQEFNNNSLSFKENKGQVLDQYRQARPDILYSGHVEGLQFHLFNKGIHYQLSKPNTEVSASLNVDEKKKKNFDLYRVDVSWLGANDSPKIIASKPLQGYENYYNVAEGNEPALEVRSYAEIAYQNIYPGIDIKFYEKSGGLEYDFIVQHGADYKNIQIEIKGADIKVNQQNELVLKTPFGEIREGALKVYQCGKRLPAKWIIQNNIVSFEIENYNPLLAIRIDPAVRVWGTYAGSKVSDNTNFDQGFSCSSDGNGNVFLAGTIENAETSTNIVSTGAHLTTYLSATSKAFLMKFDANGVRQWGTYYGGNGNDGGVSCSADRLGNVYLAGGTSSTVNIATPGAFETVKKTSYNSFLVKFNTNGVRVWGTYFGGESGGSASSCVVDKNGDVYMTGETGPTSTLATAGTYQQVGAGMAEAYLVKFNSNGNRLWCTMFGGPQEEDTGGCNVDADGNVFIVGQTASSSGISSPGAAQTVFGGGTRDAFIAKFNSSGGRLWSTYFGGPGYDVAVEFDSKPAVDAFGNVYLVGTTLSSSGIASTGAHQTTFGSLGIAGAGDAFLVKYNANGLKEWSTYYGGSSYDEGFCATSDAENNIYITGRTISTNNISTPGAYQVTKAGVGLSIDGFFAKFNGAGQRLWGSYYGGPGNDDRAWHIHADKSNNSILISGETNSTTNIASTGAHQSVFAGAYTDAFLVKFKDCPATSSSSDTAVCAFPAQLKAKNATSAASYTWSSGATTSSINVNVAGTYWVETTLNGCVSRDTINISPIGAKRANNWYFGTGLGLTFNTSPPSLLSGGQLNAHEGGSSISDVNGNLEFYTDGITVYTKNNTIMANGTGLLSNTSSTMSALLVPQPSSSTLYYIFTTPDGSSPQIGLNYSVVDMSQNSGIGAVTLKNQQLFPSSAEKVHGTKHANGIEYWIVGHEGFSNNFTFVKLTKNGIDLSSKKTQSIGFTPTNSQENCGYMKFTPDGKKLVAVHGGFGTGKIEIFDFNNNSGTLSNLISLSSPLSNEYLYGVEFSPDSKYMYISAIQSDGRIYQYDLEAGSKTALDISGSVVEIFKKSGKWPLGMQLAPDGKIYVAKAFSAQAVPDGDVFLGVINDPAVKGLASNYVDNGVDLNGQKSYSGLPIILNDLLVTPKIDFTYSDTCFNTKTAFVLSSGVDTTSISWNFGDGTSSSKANPTHLYTSKGLKTVTLSYNEVCKGTSIITKKINIVGPQLDLIDSTVCQFPLTLDALNPGATYLWSNSATTQTIAVSGKGKYTVAVTSEGCTLKDSSIVDTVIIAVKSIRAADTCFKSLTKFELIGAALDTSKFVWNLDESQTSVKSKPQYLYTSFGDKNISVNYQNECGNPQTLTQKIKILDAEKVTITSPKDSICFGETIVFTGTYTGSSTDPKSWLVNNVTQTGQSNLQFTVSNLPLGLDSVMFRVSPGSTVACATNLSATKKILVKPIKTISNTPIAASKNPICPGEAITFSTKPQNAGPAVITWLVNNVVDTVTNEPVYSFTKAGLLDKDVVRFILSSTNLCYIPTQLKSQDSIIVKIKNNTNHSLNIADTCFKSLTKFELVATALDTSKLVWNLDESQTSFKFKPQYQYTSFGDKNISVNYVDECGNPQTLTQKIKILDAEKVTVSSPKDSICFGESIVFTGTYTGPSTHPKSWLVNNVTETGQSNLQFTVNNLPLGLDSVTFRVSPGGTVACATNLSATKKILVKPIKTISNTAIAASKNPICPGEAITFSTKPQNAGPAVITWLVNNVIETVTNEPVFSFTKAGLNDKDVVKFILSSTNLCYTPAQLKSQDSIIVNVLANQTPTVSISTSTNPICINENVEVKASGTFLGKNPLFDWKVNGTIKQALSTDSVFKTAGINNDDEISADVKSNYACLLTNSASSTPIKIEVQSTFVPTIQISADQLQKCVKEFFNFKVDAITGGGSTPTLKWLVNNIVTNQTGNTFTTSALKNLDVISTSLTSSANCANPKTAPSNDLVVTVNALPILMLPRELIYCNEEQPSITIESNAPAGTYVWNTGETSADITVGDEGFYKLQITDANGCKNTDSTKVIINCEPRVFIPTAFTPNNDNKNDKLEFFTSYLTSFNIKFYNRWGEMIYETTNPDAGWDRMYKGTPIPQGTYNYICKYKGIVKAVEVERTLKGDASILE